jgi:hypothetical protein
MQGDLVAAVSKRLHREGSPQGGHYLVMPACRQMEGAIPDDYLSALFGQVERSIRAQFRRTAPSHPLDARWRDTKSTVAKGSVRDFAG